MVQQGAQAPAQGEGEVDGLDGPVPFSCVYYTGPGWGHVKKYLTDVKQISDKSQ